MKAVTPPVFGGSLGDHELERFAVERGFVTLEGVGFARHANKSSCDAGAIASLTRRRPC
jgi:hypothetical protein